MGWKREENKKITLNRWAPKSESGGGMATKEQEALLAHVGFGFYGTPAYDLSKYKLTEAIMNEMNGMPDDRYTLATYVNKDNTVGHFIMRAGNERTKMKEMGIEKAYTSTIEKAVDRVKSGEATGDPYNLLGTVSVEIVPIRRKSFVTTDLPFEERENERISNIKGEAQEAFGKLKLSTPEFVKFSVYAIDARQEEHPIPGKTVDYVVGKANTGRPSASIVVAPVAEKDRGGMPTMIYDTEGNKTPFNRDAIKGEPQVFRFSRDNLEVTPQKIQKKMTI